MSTPLITDDEIVAIAVANGLSWPVPLPTVDLSVQALAAASARGGRSLAVRGFADEVDGRLSIESVVCAPILAAANTRRWWAAYAAESSAPDVVAGSATFVYATGDPVLVDSVSPAGVHSFFDSSAADALALIGSLARNAFDYGFRGSDGGILMVGAAGSLKWAAVSRGLMSIGTLAGGKFAPDGLLTKWEAGAVQAVLIASVSEQV